MNTVKASRIDAIPVELLLHGATNVHKAVFNFILSGWNDEPIPQNWIDAIMIPLYKEGGKKSLCASYRGIIFSGSCQEIIRQTTPESF